MRRSRLRATNPSVRDRSIAGQVFALQFAMVIVATITSSTALILITRFQTLPVLLAHAGAILLALIGNLLLSLRLFTGTIVNLRDTTDQRQLAGELDSVRELAEKLHAQAHEAANQLHTVVTLVQLEKYGQAIDFGTAALTGFHYLADQLLEAVDEPALAALLLSKAAQANEQGLGFTVTADTSFRSFDIDTADLITLVGNLLDNAIDAAATTAPGRCPIAEPPATPDRQVSITIQADQHTCLVRVTDTGPGLRPEQVADAFSRGWTTKRAADGGSAGRGIGLTLVRQVVHRHGGTITVDAEHGTVFTVRLFAPTRAPAFATLASPHHR